VILARNGFVAAAAAWAAALPLATYASARLGGENLAYPFALAVYALGSVVCHQRPERSFEAWGSQLPVCARCAGIYFGAALAALVSLAPDLRMPARWFRAALLAASVPTLATLSYEWFTGDMPANALRAATGSAFGAVVAAVVVGALTSREARRTG
jgi:uncharacterized membrane protein